MFVQLGTEQIHVSHKFCSFVTVKRVLILHFEFMRLLEDDVFLDRIFMTFVCIVSYSGNSVKNLMLQMIFYSCCLEKLFF